MSDRQTIREFVVKHRAVNPLFCDSLVSFIDGMPPAEDKKFAEVERLLWRAERTAKRDSARFRDQGRETEALYCEGMRRLAQDMLLHIQDLKEGEHAEGDDAGV